LKIAETGVMGRFLMIAKEFIPEWGARSFAIMKGAGGCEFSGAAGAGVTICAAPGRRLFLTAAGQ
jgi:hypothetical protein